MAWSGSCHCGAVSFEVEGDAPRTAMSCNCSHCRRKGFLLDFVPADRFALTSGEDVLADYLFNKHAITHRFCTICGVEPFAMGKGSDGGATVAVNLRCVPEIDPDAIAMQKVDGASF